MTFQHSPADICATLLTLLQLGTDPSLSAAWPVYVNVEPDLPDELIVVNDTAWLAQGRTMPDGDTVDKYGVQIMVRSQSHLDGFQKAKAVQDALNRSVYQNLVPIGASSYDVHNVSKTQVLCVGQNVPKTKRHTFTINPYLTVTQLA